MSKAVSRCWNSLVFLLHSDSHPVEKDKDDAFVSVIGVFVF